MDLLHGALLLLATGEGVVIAVLLVDLRRDRILLERLGEDVRAVLDEVERHEHEEPAPTRPIGFRA